MEHEQFLIDMNKALGDYNALSTKENPFFYKLCGVDDAKPWHYPARFDGLRPGFVIYDFTRDVNPLAALVKTNDGESNSIEVYVQDGKYVLSPAGSEAFVPCGFIVDAYKAVSGIELESRKV